MMSANVSIKIACLDTLNKSIGNSGYYTQYFIVGNITSGPSRANSLNYLGQANQRNIIKIFINPFTCQRVKTFFLKSWKGFVILHWKFSKIFQIFGKF